MECVMVPKQRAPTPPGEILLEEFLKPLGMSQVMAARRMALPVTRVNDVVRGKRAVSADTALRLAQLFGTSPEFWMNLQAATDLYLASQELEGAGAR